MRFVALVCLLFSVTMLGCDDADSDDAAADMGGGAGGEGGEGGGAGGEGGASMPTCDDACAVVGECAAGDDLCPSIGPDTQQAFVDGCLEACAAQPALVSLVTPGDCVSTVTTLSNVNPAFHEACEGPAGDPALSMCGGFYPRPGVSGDHAVGCSTCVDESCCDEAAACGADPACLALRECFWECAGDPACDTRCTEDHADGLMPNRPYVGCRNTTCATQCRILEDWTCVGAVEAPDVEPGDADVAIAFRGFVTGAEIAGATVKACALADGACADPLGVGETDAAGVVTLTVPLGGGGFDGFFEVTGGNAAPSMWFPRPSVIVASAVPRTVTIITTTGLTALAQLAGVELDPARGHAGLRAVECTGRTAANVIVAVEPTDDATTLSYVSGGVPSAEATATDPSGALGIFNLLPGPITLTGTNEVPQQIDETTALIRPGFVTFTNLVPSP